MSVEFLEIQDPVVSSFYDKLESCYDKTEDYLEERVKSKELIEESNLVRKNVLDYITSSEIATLGEAHCDSKSSPLVEVSVVETPAATVSVVETPASTVSAPVITAPPAVTTSSASSSSDLSVASPTSPASSSSDSSVASPTSQSSSSEKESNAPTTKKQKLNEEHESAYEESFDSSSEEISIVDVVKRV